MNKPLKANDWTYDDIEAEKEKLAKMSDGGLEEFAKVQGLIVEEKLSGHRYSLICAIANYIVTGVRGVKDGQQVY